jgi:hypothetical protein
MANIIHDEGEQYLLQAALSKEQTPPANFYLGLCNDTLVKTDALADILKEPSGNGYSRQAIPSSNVGWTVAKNGDYYRATGTQETFLAAGGDWGSLNTWFLATSADGTGKLIASGDIDPARTIADGDSLLVTPILTFAATA